MMYNNNVSLYRDNRTRKGHFLRIFARQCRRKMGADWDGFVHSREGGEMRSLLLKRLRFRLVIDPEHHI